MFLEHYTFPTILASVSVAFIWTFIYDSNLVCNFLQMAGLENLIHSWLGDRRIAIFHSFSTSMGPTGQVMIMFIAGLVYT